ncbi:protein POLR1D [Pelodytes ibericus]
MAGASGTCSGIAAEENDTMQEDDLEREAVEELLKEAKRGKIRSETMGAMGWMKCPLASTNKRFLINTIKNTLPPSREKDDSDDKETDDHSREKRHSRTHKAHPYRRSGHSNKEKSHSPSQREKKREKKDETDTKRR